MIIICKKITAGSKILSLLSSVKDSRLVFLCFAALFIIGAAAGKVLILLADKTVRKYRDKQNFPFHETTPAARWSGCLLFGTVSALCLLKYGLTSAGVVDWLFLGCLFYASLTDIKSRIIPDSVHAAALIIFIISVIVSGLTVKQAVSHMLNGLVFGIAAFLLALFMDKRLHKNSLGGGDIKLLFVTGLFLSAVETLFALMTASLTALIYIVLIRVVRKKKLAYIPFGPFLALGAALMVFIGNNTSSWYLNHF